MNHNQEGQQLLLMAARQAQMREPARELIDIVAGDLTFDYLTICDCEDCEGARQGARALLKAIRDFDVREAEDKLREDPGLC